MQNVADHEFVLVEEEWATGAPHRDEHDGETHHHHQRNPDIGKLAKAFVEGDVARRHQRILRQEQRDPAEEDKCVKMVRPGDCEGRSSRRQVYSETRENDDCHYPGQGQKEAPLWIGVYLECGCHDL